MSLVKYYNLQGSVHGTCYDGARDFFFVSTTYRTLKANKGKYYPDEYLIAHILNKYLHRKYSTTSDVVVLIEPWLNENSIRDGSKNVDINRYIIEAINNQENTNKLIVVPFLYGYHHPGIVIDMKNHKIIYIDPFGLEPGYKEVTDLLNELPIKKLSVSSETSPWYVKLGSIVSNVFSTMSGFAKRMFGKIMSMFVVPSPEIIIGNENLQTDITPTQKQFEYKHVIVEQQRYGSDGTNCGPILTASMIKFIDEYMEGKSISEKGFVRHRSDIATERMFQIYLNNAVNYNDNLGIDEVMLVDVGLFNSFLTEQGVTDEEIIMSINNFIATSKKHIESLSSATNDLRAVKLIKDTQSKLIEMILEKQTPTKFIELINDFTEDLENQHPSSMEDRSSELLFFRGIAECTENNAECDFRENNLFGRRLTPGCI